MTRIERVAEAYRRGLASGEKHGGTRAAIAEADKDAEGLVTTNTAMREALERIARVLDEHGSGLKPPEAIAMVELWMTASREITGLEKIGAIEPRAYLEQHNG